MTVSSRPSSGPTPAPNAARRGGRFARLPLAYKLPLLMAVLLVGTSGLFLAVTYRVLSRAAEAEAHGRLASAASEVAASGAASVVDRHGALKAAAADPRVLELLRSQDTEGAPVEAVDALMSGLTTEAPTRTIVELRRADGSVVYRVGPEPTEAGWPTHSHDSAQVSTPMQSEAGRAYAWTIVPVVDRGVEVGWLGRRWEIGGRSGAEETLGGLAGQEIVIHMRNADASLWARQSGEVVPAPSQSSPTGPGPFTHVWPDVGRVLVAEEVLPQTPMVAVVETPLAAVRARSRAIVASLALTSLLIVVMGTLLASVIGRQVTRPLMNVTRASVAVAGGDYGQRVPVVGSDELGRLASTFNQMAEEVQSGRRELIQRIEQAQQARRDSDVMRTAAEEARNLAEEANRAKSDFLAVMSHELRTPLNAIAGYADLLELGIHGPITDAQRDALQRISRNQAHLLTLIDDVLRYAQLEAGKVEFALKVVRVESALAELETFFGPQIHAAGLAFRVAVDDPSLAVVADPDKVQQILLNLLSNAIKFTPSGTIMVSAEPDAELVHIVVQDTGVGIEKGSLEAVFDPFFQGPRRSDRPASGVGLGLAISRDLARGMGGDLSVRSVAAQGSAFTLTLRRAAHDGVGEDAGARAQDGSA